MEQVRFNLNDILKLPVRYWISIIVIALLITWLGNYILFLVLFIPFFIGKIGISSRIKRRFSGNIYAIYKAVKIFLIACIVGLIIKTFFFEIYFVPSNSMQQTLLPGDILLLNKFSYGPLVPNWLSGNNAHNKITRLNGLNSIKRNDIVVFRKPVEKRG